jgi:hypothetical protein
MMARKAAKTKKSSMTAKARLEALGPEVEGVELDDDEAPKGEEVGDAGQGVAQHAALAEHHQHEVLDALAQVIKAVLRAAQAHEAHELADAQAEGDPGCHQDDAEDDGAQQPARRPERGLAHTEAPLPVPAARCPAPGPAPVRGRGEQCHTLPDLLPLVAFDRRCELRHDHVQVSDDS